jgi:hypothetical protein
MVAQSPAASHSYVEPRQSIARSSENLSPTSGSSFVKSDLSEVRVPISPLFLRLGLSVDDYL